MKLKQANKIKITFGTKIVEVLLNSQTEKLIEEILSYLTMEDLISNSYFSRKTH